MIQKITDPDTGWSWPTLSRANMDWIRPRYRELHRLHDHNSCGMPALQQELADLP